MKKNKFYVGSSVYLVYNIDKKYYVHEDTFVVEKVSKDNCDYHYSLRNSYDDPIDWCYENMIFGTRKEAKGATEILNSTPEEK